MKDHPAVLPTLVAGLLLVAALLLAAQPWSGTSSPAEPDAGKGAAGWVAAAFPTGQATFARADGRGR